MQTSTKNEFEIGEGEIKIKFRLPKDPRQEMFDVHKTFLSVEDAEKFIKDNSWLNNASIVKVHEYVIATYINGQKI